MNWEPWAGCHKVSEGCTYCYYYGKYSKRFGQNIVTKTVDFDKLLAQTANGQYLIKGGKIIATCFSSDFFIAGADKWRADAWAVIKQRQDLEFIILTKRIERFPVSLPSDWGEGYNNVNIGCTVETQALADERLPIFLSYPVKRRFVACTPMFGPIDLLPYFNGIEHVTVGGETGREARECNYEWVLALREQCVKEGVSFWFKNTGSLFRHNGILTKVAPYKQHSMAREFNINIEGNKKLF